MRSTPQSFKLEVEAQQECMSAKAVLNRAKREILHHGQECPMGHNTGIFMTPHGRVWHVQHDCSSLVKARAIDQVYPCRWCAQVVLWKRLIEDLRDFEQVHGRMISTSARIG